MNSAAEQETQRWAHVKSGLAGQTNIPWDWNDQRKTEEGLQVHVPDDWVSLHTLWWCGVHGCLFWEGSEKWKAIFTIVWMPCYCLWESDIIKAN